MISRIFSRFKKPSAVAAPLKKQAGFSFVGVLLSLVIGTVALGIVINQYQSAEEAQNLQKNIASITQIIGTAKSTYGSVAYVGLTTPVAINARVIPTTLATNSTTAANEWGGAVTLVDNGAVTAATALLTWVNVPTSACQAMVSSTQGLARRVTVGGSDVKPLDGALVLSTLSTQCQAPATIAWTIART